MEELRLYYPDGKMVIDMDHFFPTTAKKLRKLYDVIMISADSPTEVVDRILQYMDERNAEMELTAIKASNEYVEHLTAYEEKKSQYMAGKRANGIRILKEERKEWREKIKELNKKWRSDKKQFDLVKRQQKTLSKNRALLMTLNGRC